MSVAKTLNARVSELLAERGVRCEAKPMMGGIVFMVRGKMCVGTTKNRLMVRFDPLQHDEVLARPGAGPMDFTKRVMRGFVFVSSAALPDDAALGRWLDLALAFNPQAKRSVRKKPKGP